MNVDVPPLAMYAGGSVDVTEGGCATGAEMPRESHISESAADKVRSSRETVALVTAVAQSGGQQCCVRAVHLHGEAGV